MKNFLSLILICFALGSALHAAVIVPDREDATQNDIVVQAVDVQTSAIITATAYQSEYLGVHTIDSNSTIKDVDVLKNLEPAVVTVILPDRKCALRKYLYINTYTLTNSIHKSQPGIRMGCNRNSLVFKNYNGNLVIPLQA